MPEPSERTDPIEGLRALGEERARAATPDDDRVADALDRVVNAVPPEDLVRYLSAVAEDDA